MTIILRGIVAYMTTCVRDLLHTCICCRASLYKSGQNDKSPRQSVSSKEGQLAPGVRRRCKWCVWVPARILAHSVSVLLQALQSGVLYYLNSELYCVCNNFKNEIYIMLKRISSQVAREGYVVFLKCFCRSEHYITHTFDFFPAL